MGVLRFIPILTLIVFAGCMRSTPASKTPGATTFSDSPMSVTAKPKETVVSAGWRPDEVEVDCAEKECPLQVGILLFAGEPQADGKFSVSTCTAFLSSADVITSNGHCDHFDSRRGYFVSQKVNGKKSVREIRGVVYKKFDPTSSKNPRPDVAMFRLNEPITAIPPLVLASGAQIEFNKLTAFSIFQGADANHFRVEARECTVKPHQARFAIAVREAPDVIVSFNCKMGPGTSGSPMFAPGNSQVQSIHFASDDIEANRREAREKESRDLRVDEKVTASQSTNVRCLSYPGAKPISCLTVDANEINRRWSASQQFEFDKLLSREFPGSDRFDVQFKAFRMQSKADVLDFELVYWPKCRKNNAALNSVPIFIERLKLSANDWAELTPISTSLVQANSVVKRSVGDVYEAEVSWPATTIEVQNPEQDVRRQFGNLNRIEIPLCSR